jgi:hypothetical protein
VVGTANLLVARDAGVGKVVHVVERGVRDPGREPGHRGDTCRPLESYGRVPLEAEVLCREAVASVSTSPSSGPHDPRSRRLGIFGVLFEFVADGAPVYVLGAEGQAGTSSSTPPTSPARASGRRP